VIAAAPECTDELVHIYGSVHQNYCNAANFSVQTKCSSGHTNLFIIYNIKVLLRYFLIKNKKN
jgi:hypothetical protein